MYDLNYFNQKIIIAPSYIKEDILKEIDDSNKLYNIKIISLEALYEEFTFKISKEMIYFLMKHYNTTVDIAKRYLKSLQDTMLISNDISNFQINYLIQIKNELINYHLIRENHEKCYNYYNNYQLIVIGYNYIDNKYRLLLNNFKHVTIINDEQNIKEGLIVYKFKTIEQEINYVLDDISNKIHNGVDINKIKITGVTKDYYFLLNFFSNMYNLPITIPNEISLFDTLIGKEFLESIKTNETTLFLDRMQNKELYNKFVNIINEYPFRTSFSDVYCLIMDDLKHTYLNNEYINDIKIVSFNNYHFKDDEYIYVMGLNQGSFPRVMSDEEYLSDKIKEQIGLTTTPIFNKEVKKEAMIKLSHINHLCISYSLASTFNSLEPSTIIKEYKMKEIEKDFYITNYSNQVNKYILNTKLDDYNKYGSIDQCLKDLTNKYGYLEYDSFDNSFKGINNQLLRENLKNMVTLSYTSLDKYNKCAFAYYIERILKLDIYEDKFQTKVGSVFHYVLEKAFQKSFNFENEYQKGIDLYFNNMTNKEEFLLIRLKEELKFVINTINEQLEYINYDQTLYEHKVDIEINANLKIKFSGVIDKLFFKESDTKTYVAIIDYKTGSITTSINNSKYGLNLQLPIYIYLSKKSDLKNVVVTGFYYQTILQNEIKADNNIDYLDKKKKYLRLQGYTLDTTDDSIKFDKTEANSKLIQSLRRKQDGTFDSRSKVLTQEDIDSLEKLVEIKIKEAGNDIINGKFNINPKEIDKANVSCKLCKYKDLCYMKQNDIVKLSKVEDLSFLREYK